MSSYDFKRQRNHRYFRYDKIHLDEYHKVAKESNATKIVDFLIVLPRSLKLLSGTYKIKHNVPKIKAAMYTVRFHDVALATINMVPSKICTFILPLNMFE